MNSVCKLVVLTVLLLTGTANAQQTIPFELRKDNRIYVNATLNKSKKLTFVLDLGANVTVVNKTRLESNKISLKFNKSVLNKGLNGTLLQEISEGNVVEVGGIRHHDDKVLGISYPKNETFDGIIGWNFFKGKSLKINFENSTIAVFDRLPKMADGYVKSDMKFIEDLPYIKSSIQTKEGTVEAWAMLDTGYNQTLSINYSCSKKYKLIGQFPIIGEATTKGANGNITKSEQVLLPRFRINGFEIYNMPTFITKTKTGSNRPNILGGSLLKRFHIVLDFRNKHVYLMPNIHINSRFLKR